MPPTKTRHLNKKKPIPKNEGTKLTQKRRSRLVVSGSDQVHSQSVSSVNALFSHYPQTDLSIHNEFHQVLQM